MGSQQGTATSSSAEATKQQDNQGLQHFDNDTDTDEEDEVNSEKKDREVEPNSADSEDFLAEFPDETDVSVNTYYNSIDRRAHDS